MRLFCVFPFLSLLFGARASSLDSRRPDAHPLDARDVSNVCATITPTSGHIPEADRPWLLIISELLGISSQFNGHLSQSIPSVLNNADRYLPLSV